MRRRHAVLRGAAPLAGGGALCAIAAWRSRGHDPDSLALGSWLLGMVVMAVPVATRSRKAEGGSSALRRVATAADWRRGDTALAMGLFGVALALRFYRLGPLLPAVHGDEGEMGLLARTARDGALPYFGTGFLDHPTLFHHVQAVVLRLVGDDIVALRSLSVVVGALCAPTVYAIGRLGWGRVAGVAAGWLLAVAQLHIHYSRLALNNIETVWAMTLLVLVALAIWTLGELPPAVGGRSNNQSSDDRRSLFVAAGLVVGLSQYFYYGSRLLAVVAVPLAVLLVRARRARVGHLVVGAWVAVASTLPLSVYYLDHRAAFINRTRGVSVFNEAGVRHTLGPDADWPGDGFRLLVEQLRRNVGFFLGEGDVSAFHLRVIASFDGMTVLLMVVGSVILVARLRSFPAQAVLIWLVAGVVLSGVLTNDAPNGPRLIVTVPAALVAAGVAVEFLAGLALRPRAARPRELAAAGAVLAVVVCWLNLRLYFTDYDRLQAGVLPGAIGELVDDEAGTNEVLLLGAPQVWSTHGAIRFVGRDAAVIDVVAGEDIGPYLAAAHRRGHGLVVAAIGPRSADLAVARRFYPGSEVEIHTDRVGRVIFSSYEIAAD